MNNENQQSTSRIEPPNPASAEPAIQKPRESGWERAKFVLQAIEVRLRFIALFVGIGLLMVYWRTIENYWDRWTRPTAQAMAADADTEFYCPMHPNVIRAGLEPNGAVPNCPICGMPLSQRKKGAAPKLREGITARVQLSPQRIKLAGVETTAASYMPLMKEVRTVGYVAYDERRLSEIVTRFAGYIEELYIDNTFARVTKGDPLAEIYSPELYSSVQELRLAQKHNSADLIASSRKRLALFGISDAEIDEILADDSDRPRLLVRSPQSGQVIVKNVVQGSSVASGTTLFKIAELSDVWIEADVFESDLPFLYEGQAAVATVEAFPGQQFAGTVSLIYPELNPETRTSRIRISLPNPDLTLRPGMYATVRIQSPMSEAPTVRARLASIAQTTDLGDEALIASQKICPVTGAKLGSMGAPVKTHVGDQVVFLCCEGCEKPLLENPAKYMSRLTPRPEGAVLSILQSAVIDTGRMKVVYVEREPGMFEGVEVELGPRAEGFYPVLAGLAPGDRVATAGSFLLDAETRLNPAAASAYFGASGGPSGGVAPAAQNDDAATAPKADKAPEDLSAEHKANVEKLPPGDRELALQQRICPVTGEQLGSMGVPIKVVVRGRPVFVCCKGCVTQLQENPEKFLKTIRPTSLPPALPNPPATSHQH